MNNKTKIKESDLHMQVVNYLKAQYPKIIFRTDFSSGCKMTIGQAVRHKQLQMCRAYPDLFIAHPMGGYAGLFIEIKTSVSEVLKKDMTPKTEHIKEQFEMIAMLEEKGYKAVMCCGFDSCKNAIDNYLCKQK